MMIKKCRSILRHYLCECLQPKLIFFIKSLNKFFIFFKIRFQNRRMKLKKEIQAIKELNEQEKQAQAQKAALVAQGHSIEGT